MILFYLCIQYIYLNLIYQILLVVRLSFVSYPCTINWARLYPVAVFVFYFNFLGI